MSRDFERERRHALDRFDPVAEGARHGVSRAQALAIWARARADATEGDGRREDEHAQRRFHALAAYVAAHGGRLQPDVGKQSGVEPAPTSGSMAARTPAARRPGGETLLTVHAASAAPSLARVPGRSTQVARESRRWAEPVAQSAQGSADARPSPVATPSSAPASCPVVIEGGVRRVFGFHRTALHRPGRGHALAPDRGRPAPAPSLPWLAPPVAGLTAAVMRSAEHSAIDPAAGELVARARRGGAPLDAALQARLEATLGARLDGVRVHTGPDADAAARALGARAFAIGDDVMFRDGAYDPHARDGQRLIAHEVAHTVQARRTPHAGGGAVSQPGDAVEREADAIAEAFVGKSAPEAARHTEAAPHAAARPSLREPLPTHQPPAQASVSTTSASTTSASTMIYRQSAPAELQGQRSSVAALEHPGARPEVAHAYDAFLDGVYAAAEQIVSRNLAAVRAWRDYVLSQLSPRELGAQVFGTGFEQLQGQATANHAEHLLAPYSNEANPVRQELYEHQIAGEWRACTGCHVSNQAWEVDARMKAAHDPGVTPAELLRSYAPTASGGRSLDLRIWTDPNTWGEVFAPANPAQTHAAKPTGPAAGSLGSSGSPGSLGSPVRSNAPSARVAGPDAALASARQSLAQIQPQLQPLDDAGYKILPSNLISRFGRAPIEQLKAELQAAFTRRLSGYLQLNERIRAHRIDYLEFDTLVALLSPMASREVRALIDVDIHRREVREIVTFVGLLVVDLLSIVIPPLSLVAGALHVAHGIDQSVVGRDRAHATGAHGVMSPERQASGPLMQVAGTLEVLGGAVQTGMAAAGLKAPGGGGNVITRHTRGGITLEVMDNGVVRASHVAYPGKSIVMQPDGTFHALDELGHVVGTGVIGKGGGQAAAAEAWGGSAAAPAATGTELTRRAPSLAPAPRATSPWPAVSPFYTGGTGPGTFAPNEYNPSGRDDNCGYTCMSYAHQLQNPGAPLRSADDLYLQRLQQLGIPVDDHLSRQLVFPDWSFDRMGARPGYAPMFDSNGGNRLSEYTFPTTARALGVAGREANDAMRRWAFAFGDGRSLEGAVDARVQFLESNGQSPSVASVRKWVMDQRAELPGVYIVGSYGSAHYMTIEISPAGEVTGFDPQDYRRYPSRAAVEARMGTDKFELMYKLDIPLPPEMESR